MRTTLDIEEDLLLAAKEIARMQGTSTGKIVSELVRQALTTRAAVEVRDGLPVFPLQPDARPVTLEMVNRLRDEGY